MPRLYSNKCVTISWMILPTLSVLSLFWISSTSPSLITHTFSTTTSTDTIRTGGGVIGLNQLQYFGHGVSHVQRLVLAIQWLHSTNCSNNQVAIGISIELCICLYCEIGLDWPWFGSHWLNISRHLSDQIQYFWLYDQTRHVIPNLVLVISRAFKLRDLSIF